MSTVRLHEIRGEVEHPTGTYQVLLDLSGGDVAQATVIEPDGYCDPHGRPVRVDSEELRLAIAGAFLRVARPRDIAQHA